MPTTLAAAGLKSLAGPGSTVARAVDQLPAMPTNISDLERGVSAAAGVGLLVVPVGGLVGLASKLAGAALLLRGATGHCMGYQLLGVSSQGTNGTGEKAVTSVPHDSGVRVEQACTVNRSPAEVYAFWRDYANLPKFQGMVESVTDLGGDKSHWVAKGPLGVTLEWDAELVNDQAGQVIAWKSLPGGDLGTAGSVHFTAAPGGRGTEVRVNVKFDAPGGKLGTAVATLMGQDPHTQTRADLHKLKQLLEAGELATVEGQSSGRR